MWWIKEFYGQRHIHRLTIVQNVIAILLVLLVNMVSDYLVQQMNNQLIQLGIGVNMLTVADDQLLKAQWQQDFIKDYSVEQFCYYYQQEYGDLNLICCNNNLNDLFALSFEQGTFFSEMDELENKNVAVLGSESAAYFQNAAVGDSININGADFKVVGILEKDYENIFLDLSNAIILPVGYVEDNMSVSYYFSCFEELSDLDSCLKEDNYLLISQKSTEQAFESLLTICQNTLLSLSYVSFIVATVGIVNITLSNIQQRKREIGIKKALGASDKAIGLQFIIEILILLLLSIAMALLVLLIIKLLLLLLFDLDIPLNLQKNQNLIFIILLVGGLSGGYPAYYASKIEIIDAIYNEAL